MNIPISYKTLASYFEKGLPKPEVLSDIFLKHVCEVEGMGKKGEDIIFDLKITPDRGDLLSYRGIAREVAAHCGEVLKQENKKTRKQENKNTKDTRELFVSVDDSRCSRYIGRVIEGIRSCESPAWLREVLEASGQRSINVIVDVTNFVMLEMGQPMHAFDGEKISPNEEGEIIIMVRPAYKEEHIQTLDGRNIALPEGTLVISDYRHALAIAGIKGGIDAGVTDTTKTIILESAVFDGVAVRKTSRALGIITDSSRRYEHGRAPAVALDAMNRATEILLGIFPEAHAGEIVDVYPRPAKQYYVVLSAQQVENILGTPYSTDDLVSDLYKTGFQYEKIEEKFSIMIPPERFDLRISEDIVEEIVRLRGFHNISALPLMSDNFIPVRNDMYDAMIRVRNALVPLGFSEIINHTFSTKGLVPILNPIAEGSDFLRDNLIDGMREALIFNAHNAPLLGVDEICIFEIGTVFFAPDKEEIHCSLGVYITKKMKDVQKKARESELLTRAQQAIEATLGKKLEWNSKDTISECALVASDKLSASMYDPLIQSSARASYCTISHYPFVLRDLAVWTESKMTNDEILNIICSTGSDLLIHTRLFDVFTKDFDGIQKTSYAFNLVFQSQDRTLSDTEVHKIMESIVMALTVCGIEVR